MTHCLSNTRFFGTAIGFVLLLNLIVSCHSKETDRYSVIYFNGFHSPIIVNPETMELRDLNDSILRDAIGVEPNFPDVDDSCMIFLSKINFLDVEGLNCGNCREYLYDSNCKGSLFTSFVFDEEGSLLFCIDQGYGEEPGSTIFLKKEVPIAEFMNWFERDTCLLFSKMFTLKPLSKYKGLKFTE